MSYKLTKHKLLEFLHRLGEKASTPGKCYLTGGTSAILIGWRDTTIDIDLKFDPEPSGVFESIPKLKHELSVNIELASPDDFIPALPHWRERSQFIGSFGNIEVFHYDFVAQALSKIVRGHDRDLTDVREMLARRLTDEASIRASFDLIRPSICRYPALDEGSIALAIDEFFSRGPHVS